ncbi:MAG: DNA/RNA nuclease SfsA [Pseudomonadota bacterium]|nr:DNA/RNA nuclease SfsA [Pseudomonadota bacterium]
MIFDPPLIQGRLLRRYKRFLADVRLADGRQITAHCPNPGSMLSLLDPGRPEPVVWLTAHDDPRRKLQWTLELLDVDGTLVCINTQRPNAVAAEAVTGGRIPSLAGYGRIRREVRYGEKSRIDLLLEGSGRPPCHVEVKSVTMSRTPGVVEFPDSRTARGARHLDELAAVVRDGGRAVMLYLSPRDDGRSFRLAGDIDPAYAAAFRAACAAGVEAVCHACSVSPNAIYPGDPLPVLAD